MDRQVLISLIISLLILIILIFTSSAWTIDAALVKGQTKCVAAPAALNFIEAQGCVRTYNDARCGEQGKVEISC